MTLTCQHISLFLEDFVEKRAGKFDKNISPVPVPSIVHTHFTCYEYVLKKFTALNYTNKHMTLACQFRALLPDSKSSMETIHRRVAHPVNTSHTFYLLLIKSK